MRLALGLHRDPIMASVISVGRLIREALARSHEVYSLSSDSPYCLQDEQEREAADLVERCDVIVGFPRSMRSLLSARHRVRSGKPVVAFLLGSLPRGAHSARRTLPLFRSSDLFVVNCAADLSLFAKLFANGKLG